MLIPAVLHTWKLLQLWQLDIISTHPEQFIHSSLAVLQHTSHIKHPWKPHQLNLAPCSPSVLLVLYEPLHSHLESSNRRERGLWWGQSLILSLGAVEKQTRCYNSQLAPAQSLLQLSGQSLLQLSGQHKTKSEQHIMSSAPELKQVGIILLGHTSNCLWFNFQSFSLNFLRHRVQSAQ